MTLWLVRAGSSGEYESKFLSDGRIYLTWEGLNADLSAVASREDLFGVLARLHEEDNPNRLHNWVSQIWPFGNEMAPGDWVVLPSKKKASIHFGEITGDYVHYAAGPDPYFHFRTVNWFATDIPRTQFDQDILYSFGAFLTICRISRNNAEERVRQMAKNGWKSSAPTLDLGDGTGDTGETSGYQDVEQGTRDQIAKFIERKYKGHGMTRLVEAILKALGYTTYRSPEGADKGVDLLAGSGPLGFEAPRICVQVKTTDTAVDRPTLDQLIGTMQNFGAERGLLVSWSGFRSTVEKEIPSQFFRVRLWDQAAILDELLESYDRMDEEFRAELPLKRVWALALPGEE